MKYLIAILACSTLLGCVPNERKSFYSLGETAKQSFNVGKHADARKQAQQLLSLASKFKDDWNYGNAVHDGNVVLGRLALIDGKVAEAKQYLLEAGKSPGSPQMNSFGPNMSLAKDLLEKGEREVVQEYFELCRRFWKMGGEQLDKWREEVKSEKLPDFGPNLVY